MKRVFSGKDTFINGGKLFEGKTVLDFWNRHFSRLGHNLIRGHLAEYIVSVALGVDKSSPGRWDSYDLEKNGVKFEVKCTSRIQDWGDEELEYPNKVMFRVGFDGEGELHADYYVFALLDEDDKSKFNPIDLSQWKFWVFTRSTIRRWIGDNKTKKTTISVGSLENIREPFDFEGLSKRLRNICRNRR